MTSSWPSLALAITLLGPATLRAQEVLELGAQGLVTTSNPALVTGGLYAALRPTRRARLAATLGAGVSDGRTAGRGELLAHFLLSPGAVRRPGLYVGGGVAGVVGAIDQGYIVVLAGVESAPGAASGWAVEAGVGGGIRLTAGWRWRWRAGRK